jgi:metal-responsive CopG/Arc/MetJ family transcriptional regulator
MRTKKYTDIATFTVSLPASDLAKLNQHVRRRRTTRSRVVRDALAAAGIIQGEKK